MLDEPGAGGKAKELLTVELSGCRFSEPPGTVGITNTSSNFYALRGALEWPYPAWEVHCSPLFDRLPNLDAVEWLQSLTS